MSDLYSEFIVKRKTPMTVKAMKFGLITLTVFVFLMSIVIQYAIIAALVLALLCFYLLPKFEIEYEYLYVNGELDIDKIMSKSKRKKIISLDLQQLEILAPVKSHHLDSYNSNKNIKVKDYSSSDPSHTIYAMVIQREREMVKVLFEPNDTILNDIKRIAPRKVFMD